MNEENPYLPPGTPRLGVYEVQYGVPGLGGIASFILPISLILSSAAIIFVLFRAALN